MFIRTARLFLRPIFPEDWHAIYRGIADYDVVSMLARAPWPYNQADARAFAAQAAVPGALKFAVTLPEQPGAPLIGVVSIDPHEGAAPELGYWIAQDWQRQGYATEAAHGALQVGDAIGLERVVAGHYLDNAASAKVLRASGFVETGEVLPTACAARGGEMVLARRYERVNPAIGTGIADRAA